MRVSTIFVIILLIGLSSCEKELDFHYHDVESQIVIEGNLSENGSVVSITKTTPMAEPIMNNRITSASVMVKDYTSGEVFQLMPDKNGLYVNPIAGISGHKYELEVSYDCKKFRSTSLMRPACTILSMEFQWIKMPYDKVAVLQIAFTDTPASDDCYWIRLYRNSEPYKWILSDDRRSVKGIIHEVIMTTRRDTDEEDDRNVILEGDFITANVCHISRDMYDYLTALENDSNGPTMFSGDFCLGYFLASSYAKDSVVFTPSDMPLYK